MKAYGQYCPVAKGAEVFAERWTPLVLRTLLCGSRHFNDVHRGVPLMSRTLLSRRLKQLEALGIIRRRAGTRGPEYTLTKAGREFAPIIRKLGEWGQRWVRTKFDREDLDITVLMWDMSHGVDASAFENAGRIAVRFDFTDVPITKRTWWLVNEDGAVDLCPTEPGFEVSLYVTTDLRSMTRVWMGDLDLIAAIDSGRIKLDGRRELCKRFARWLKLSSFAGTAVAPAPAEEDRQCRTPWDASAGRLPKATFRAGAVAPIPSSRATRRRAS
jgi:DNA-binding HxlR family transcriptional regulator